MEYLGFRITPGGIKMDPVKVAKIKQWEAPLSVKQVRGFLGFANFYRRFIKAYSIIALPLFNLLKKDAPFDWNQDCQNSFDLFKRRFTTEPILRHFQPDLDTRIETDASDYAVAAVLLQRHDDGNFHPIAFASRTMSPAEHNYDIHSKEMLAVIFACQEWRSMLLSLDKPFQSFVDHKSLEYFLSKPVLTRREARWSIELSNFPIEIVYRPGTSNSLADPLSRRDDVYPAGDSSFATNNPQNTQPFFQPHHLRLARTSTYDADTLFHDLRLAQLNDPKVQAQSKLVGTNPKYTIDNDLLRLDGRIIVPDDANIKLRILQSRHDHPVAGHPGRTKTLELLRLDFHWDGIRQYVADYVEACATCIRMKYARHKRYGELQPLPIPDRPWSSLSMDFIDQLPPSHGFDAILVVVCRLTKMALFIPTTTTITSEELARVYLRHVFSKHGVPSDIVSDRGSKFTSTFWKSLSEALGITQNLSTAYHPETDGQTERVNQVVETYIRLYVNYDQDDWNDFLPLAEFAYNNTPHSSTTMSPFFLNKGFHPTLDITLSASTKKNLGVTIERLHELHEHAKQEIAKALAKNERDSNAHRLPAPKYEEGDKVYLSTVNLKTTRPTKKFAERRLGPFTISKVVSPLAMKLDLPSYLSRLHPVFHVNLLEPAPIDKIPNRKQPPPPPVTIDKEVEWEVNGVLDSRVRGKRLEYLVEWSGYEDDDVDRATWEPAEALDNAPEYVAEFHRTHPNKPCPRTSRRSSKLVMIDRAREVSHVILPIFDYLLGFSPLNPSSPPPRLLLASSSPPRNIPVPVYLLRRYKYPSRFGSGQSSPNSGSYVNGWSEPNNSCLNPSIGTKSNQLSRSKSWYPCHSIGIESDQLSRSQSWYPVDESETIRFRPASVPFPSLRDSIQSSTLSFSLVISAILSLAKPSVNVTQT